MKHALLVLRGTFLWVLSILHFFVAAPTLVLIAIFLDPREHDWLQRAFCRRIAFLSGARVEVPAKKVPYFKPSKELRDLVNPGEAAKA